jgi:hypothetical protein
VAGARCSWSIWFPEKQEIYAWGNPGRHTGSLAGVNAYPKNPVRFDRWISLLAFACGIVGVTAQASERWATLEAIHQLENPRNTSRPGPRGELGPYQFRSGTWRMHTKVPFERALDRKTSDLVAVRHYEWLKQNLERARLPATPYNIALAWNSGLAAAIDGRSPAVAHDYASRAARLAAVFVESSRVALAQ